MVKDFEGHKEEKRKVLKAIAYTEADGGEWIKCNVEFHNWTDEFNERSMMNHCIEKHHYALQLSDGRVWDVYKGFRGIPVEKIEDTIDAITQSVLSRMKLMCDIKNNELTPSPTVGPEMEIWCSKDAFDKLKKMIPPAVEISLEDAKVIADSVRLHSTYIGSYRKLKEAISKAEGKDTPKEPEISQVLWQQMEQLKDEMLHFKMDIIDRLIKLEDRLSPVNAKAQMQVPVNTPALPIQDQVNELRKELSTLKDTISQLQSVIEGMNGKSV